jgi:hypothetical protein
MAAAVSISCMVAIYYIDVHQWFVGKVKEKRDDDDTWGVQFGRSIWPATLDDSSYGENKLWIIVTKKQGASAAKKRPADTTDDTASAESEAGGTVVQPSIVVEAGAATDSDAGVVCSYASVAGLGCKSQTPSQELSKCSERGCNTLLHRTCFAHHFPSQVEGVFGYSKRRCPQHAQDAR